MEVSWKDTALSRTRRHHKEVEGLGFVAVLDQSTVHNAAGRRIYKLTGALFLDKETLRDSLVNDDEGDLWRLGSTVVQFAEGLAELLNLLVDDLLALGIADTIAVDDQVRWELPVVVLREDLNGLLQAVLHLSLDDLLALRLHDVLRVVLAHLRVSAGGKANN